jgi:hypothetical protein
MPILFFLLQYQEAILILLKKLFNNYFYNNLHFLPFWRANLTTSPSLWPIRGIQVQLHEPLSRRCSNLGA